MSRQHNQISTLKDYNVILSYKYSYNDLQVLPTKDGIKAAKEGSWNIDTPINS